MDSDSEVNVGEEVKVGDILPVSGECSTGDSVTIGGICFVNLKYLIQLHN